jgi:hypothetical protein
MPEFVNMPVPVDRVQDVYELLARPSAARSALGPQVTDNGYPEGWSQAMVERMFIESSSAMRRILCSIAERSPSWVTTGEIGAASELSPRQVIASLGPFEKRVRGRYGMNRWPFEAREFVDAGIFKYSMSEGTAAGILRLMAHVEEHEKSPGA